jgi:hypothetical protein
MIKRKNILEYLKKSEYVDIETGWEPLTLQSFSQGGFATLWVVDVPRPRAVDVAAADKNAGHISDSTSAPQASGGHRNGDEVDEGWEGMLSQYGRSPKKEKDERRRITQKPGGVDHDSTWTNKTGWVKHFQGPWRTFGGACTNLESQKRLAP